MPALLANLGVPLNRKFQFFLPISFFLLLKEMHWKIFTSVSATILISAILHYLVRKNDDKVKLVTGLCISILFSVFALFLVFGDKIERGIVEKKDLQLLSIMDSQDDDPYCYVKGFSDRIQLDAFPTFDQAKEKGGACVVYDPSESSSNKFWAFTFDNIPGGKVPEHATTIGNSLTETIHSCAAGFITTRI